MSINYLETLLDLIDEIDDEVLSAAPEEQIKRLRTACESLEFLSDMEMIIRRWEVEVGVRSSNEATLPSTAIALPAPGVPLLAHG
jgi:hypothetical protein